MEIKTNLIISTGHRNWAIGELALNIKRHSKKLVCRIVEFPQSRRQIRSLAGFGYFPNSQMDIYMHQDLAIEALKKKWLKPNKPTIVRYTHNNKNINNYSEIFRISKMILVENTQIFNEIQKLGINSKKIIVKPHPIEIRNFKNLNCNQIRDVIFVSNFYERKNPELIKSLIEFRKDLHFTIYGKNWEKYEKYTKLKKLSNLEYKNFIYSNYPEELGKHKIFCSLSKIEGGPVPLLESLAAGLIPVVTDTGYCRDVLPNEYLRFILPIESSLEEISVRIDSALKSEPVKLDIEKYDLNNFINFIDSLI